MAREIEKAGISTICTTFRKDIIELTRPPRVLSMKFSPGKPLGNPGDIDTQNRIIEDGYDLLQKDISEMTIMDLPYKLGKFEIV